MTIRRRPLYLGVFLVTAGAVMFIGQGANVDRGAVADALSLWPLAVIAAGVGLLVRRTPAALPAGMIAAAMPGLLLGGVVVAAPEMTINCQDRLADTTQTRDGSFPSQASVHLVLACGDLEVSTTPGSGWHLETRSPGEAAPTVSVAGDRITVASIGGWRTFGPRRAGDIWKLSLPTGSTLDLVTEVSAGHGRLDLAGARLSRLDVSVNAADMSVDLGGATVDRVAMHVNAGSGSLRLPATGDIDADLSVDVGKLSVCAPADLGLRVSATVSLGSIDHTALVRNGDSWETPGYASAQYHANVTVSASVGSVDINPEGGCQ
jgi:hypothetical protein